MPIARNATKGKSNNVRADCSQAIGYLMFSFSALLFGISRCCSPTHVGENRGLKLKLKKLGHFVLNKCDKMLSKICGCS